MGPHKYVGIAVLLVMAGSIFLMPLAEARAGSALFIIKVHENGKNIVVMEQPAGTRVKHATVNQGGNVEVNNTLNGNVTVTITFRGLIINETTLQSGQGGDFVVGAQLPLGDYTVGGDDIFIDGVPNVLPNSTFTLIPAVQGVPTGGQIIPIDMTSLFLAGVITNASWIVPTLGGIAGAAFALFVVRRKHNQTRSQISQNNS